MAALARREWSRGSSTVVDRNTEQDRSRQAGTSTAIAAPRQCSSITSIPPPPGPSHDDCAPSTPLPSSHQLREPTPSIPTRAVIRMDFKLAGRKPRIASIPASFSTVGSFFDHLEAFNPRQVHDKDLQMDAVNVEAKYPTERLSEICVSYPQGFSLVLLFMFLSGSFLFPLLFYAIRFRSYWYDTSSSQSTRTAESTQVFGSSKAAMAVTASTEEDLGALAATEISNVRLKHAEAKRDWSRG